MQALIFDLDGTLIDTVYAHVFAWQRRSRRAASRSTGGASTGALAMSGGLAARAAARELGREIDAAQEEILLKSHGEPFRQFLPERRPLPGAIELLRDLRARCRCLWDWLAPAAAPPL